MQLVHQNSYNRATDAYNKTSSSLKRKEKDFDHLTPKNKKPTREELQDFEWHKNKNPNGVIKELLWVGEWLLQNPQN